MIKLGITGQIASGKSTVAREFAKFGGKVISADQIGKEVVEETPHILSKLIRAFGPQIVTPQGVLKRRELGKIVFASAEKREMLNRIVHPPLLQRLKEEMDHCSIDPECGMAIIDAALLVDWGWHEKMDWTVCVVSAPDTQLLRLKAEGLTENEISDRISSQKSREEFMAASDFVIENDGTLKELKEKV
nr:dephospho-CoA kinase [candidate division Zixibacteria bacterium]NIR66758.1 dephospho-CoA kinase [candidate division Zixibacteria bacterium]NIS15107.1 dephospho-CoA kinase [candidate division Zixibacteria bacterium]NIS48305.1 dephospho-CoA kinase [candidate division Zixibacteria bacterium]NIT51604.1 dephospho-CoA kinase [candidate division Zixibacteria bacterium]